MEGGGDFHTKDFLPSSFRSISNRLHSPTFLPDDQLSNNQTSISKILRQKHGILNLLFPDSYKSKFQSLNLAQSVSGTDPVLPQRQN